jgi:N-acetylglucosamine-6-phosphate deacetylase
MRRLLAGARIFTGRTILADHALLVDDAEILDIVPAGSDCRAARLDLPDTSLLAPGLIDLQVNGGGGVLFNDSPTLQGILAIAAAHRRLGITGLLPTVITDMPEVMLAAAQAAAEATAIPGSGVLGVHLEGPFFNPERSGVHQERFIRVPQDADLVQLCALPARFAPHGRVLLTLAPEQVPLSAITRLVEAGLRVSGGHSAATLECTQAALRAGMSGFTHLFNAMPPLSSRAPGIALAAMTDPDSCCGIIADGIHVHPAMLRLALGAKLRGGLFLVSDSMPPAATGLAEFMLQGRRIHRRNGRLETEYGVLAGADIDLSQAVRNAVSLLGVPPEEALRMASLYPARFLGLDDRLGRLEPGYRADIVLLNEELCPLATWVAGQHQPASAAPATFPDRSAGPV